MNKIEASAKIEELRVAAATKIYVIGQPSDVQYITENGTVIGAVRSAGTIRFKINGIYKSAAKALQAMEG